MLEIGKSNEVKFKVSVNGTSATPAVRLVIEAPDAELGFTCNQGDGHWFTSITLPEDMEAGNYPFRVEVVVNNKLFTPVRKTVTVARASEIPAVAPAPEIPTPEIKAPEFVPPVAEEVASPSIKTLTNLLKGVVVEKPVNEKKPNLMKEVAVEKSTGEKKPSPVKEAVTDKKPAPKIENLQPEPAKTRAPKKPAAKREPIRINIAEIVADSNRRFDKVLKESASYRKPGKAVIPINLNINVPISLKKEEVVYE